MYGPAFLFALLSASASLVAVGLLGSPGCQCFGWHERGRSCQRCVDHSEDPQLDGHAWGDTGGKVDRYRAWRDIGHDDRSRNSRSLSVDRPVGRPQQTRVKVPLGSSF